MSVDAHRQAESLMAEADRLAAAGEEDDAAQRYREAAALEGQAFRHIPPTRPRTRGIIAVSAVSLYRRAGTLGEAIRHAHRYLVDPSLPDFAQEQLQAILDDARSEERARAVGHTLGMQELAVSLREGPMAAGGVSFDTFILKLQQIERFAWRTIEWVAQQPFREKGPVPRELLELCRPIISEPSAGSLRFKLKLEMPLQLPLQFPEEPSITAESVSQEFFRIMQRIANAPEDKLELRIRNPQYREIFLKLVRNIVPDGRELREISFLRHYKGGTMKASLLPRHRHMITRNIDIETHGVERKSTQVGVLRALHLDEGWLLLTKEDGSEQRCSIGEHKVFDDVVGPFVNRIVQVPGHWKGRRFFLHDIVPYTGDLNDDA